MSSCDRDDNHIGNFECITAVDDVWEIFAGKADCGAEIDHAAISCPVTASDWQSVGVVVVQAVEIFLVFKDVWAQFLFI